MSFVFEIVASSLQLISFLTGLTYQEINIIVYYIVIPFVYLTLVDKICKRHWFKIIFAVGVCIFFLSIRDFRVFSERLFEQSVIFLESFSKIGWDYIAASVIICVIVPGILFGVLFYCAYKSEIQNRLKGTISMNSPAKPKSLFKRILLNLVRFLLIFVLLALVAIKGCELYLSPRF